MAIEEGTGWNQKSGVFFGKKCAQCGSRFPKMGANAGFVGILLCLLLFGGTSKYCPSCRSALKEQKAKVDKGPLFRLIWFGALVLIGYLLSL